MAALAVFLQTRHDTGQRVLAKSLLNLSWKCVTFPEMHGTDKVEYMTEVDVQADELKRIGQG